MQKHISRQKAIDKIEITLKSIKTLTYACSDAKLLVDLNEKLQHAVDELQSQLPHAEGLLLRPALIPRALSTKKKYKRLQYRCSQLKTLQHGRRQKADSKYRNRHGSRANRLRKVWYLMSPKVRIYQHLYTTLLCSLHSPGST